MNMWRCMMLLSLASSGCYGGSQMAGDTDGSGETDGAESGEESGGADGGDTSL